MLEIAYGLIINPFLQFNPANKGPSAQNYFAWKKLKQMDRFASLNHNIYIAANPSALNVDNAAHACHYIVRPHCLLGES